MVISFLKTVDSVCVNSGCSVVWFVPSHMKSKARFNESWLI